MRLRSAAASRRTHRVLDRVRRCRRSSDRQRAWASPCDGCSPILFAIRHPDGRSKTPPKPLPPRQPRFELTRPLCKCTSSAVACVVDDRGSEILFLCRSHLPLWSMESARAPAFQRNCGAETPHRLWWGQRAVTTACAPSGIARRPFCPTRLCGSRRSDKLERGRAPHQRPAHAGCMLG